VIVIANTLAVLGKARRGERTRCDVDIRKLIPHGASAAPQLERYDAVAHLGHRNEPHQFELARGKPRDS
jgi:hypothetical protein